MHPRAETAAGDGALADARGYTNAILNILEDSTEEALRLNDMQRAMINIFDYNDS